MTPSELEQLGKIREALEPLIDTARTYAMQTYDRSGCTRKQIEAGKEALDLPIFQIVSGGKENP